MSEKLEVTYLGRAYPTPERAVARLKKTLEILGVPYEEGDVEARLETPGAICGWGAVARVMREDWERRRTAEDPASRPGGTPFGERPVE